MRRLALFSITSLLLFTAFTRKKDPKVKLPKEFAYIPRGTMSIDTGECVGCQTCGIIVSFSSFYISKYEVSNEQYRRFYSEVSPTMTAEQREEIACDSLGWRQELTYCEPMMKFYYQHPAYNQYPAVNIPYKGALQYCQWLQEKIQKENPGFIIEVKLPEKQQWIYAARGGRSQAMYPWGNYYLRNKKGEFLCNFNRISDYDITRNRQTGKPEVHEPPALANDRAFYTENVKSFYPNDFGLYNMCGNAAEMIAENGTAMGGSWNDYGGDVHIKAESAYTGPASTVGFRPIIIIQEKQ